MAKPVDYGRRSRIYDNGNHTVLKLYDKGFPEDKIKREFENTLAVYNLKKLLVPKPLELVKKDGQTGILFEKVQGISLMNLFQKNPLLYFTYGKTITSLHHKVNEIEVTTLPSQKSTFSSLIKESPRLNKEEKNILVNILNENTKSNLCHGDFHHGNIILTPTGEYFILDWMDAFGGNPLLDVALTAVNAAVSDAPPHIPYIYAKAYDLLKRILKLDKRYLHLYGVDEKVINKYLLLSAGIHLARAENGKSSSHIVYFERLIMLNHNP